MTKQRRYKILWVSEQNILFAVSGLFDMLVRVARGEKWWCSVPVIKGLPATAYVGHAWHDMTRGAFALCIYDESFPVVPDCCPIPAIEDWEGVTLDLTKWQMVPAPSEIPTPCL